MSEKTHLRCNNENWCVHKWGEFCLISSSGMSPDDCPKKQSQRRKTTSVKIPEEVSGV